MKVKHLPNPNRIFLHVRISNCTLRLLNIFAEEMDVERSEIVEESLKQFFERKFNEKREHKEQQEAYKLFFTPEHTGNDI